MDNLDGYNFLIKDTGNQHSVKCFLDRLGLDNQKTLTAKTLLVINGVGHIDNIYEILLNRHELVQDHLQSGGQMLAICLGMQALMSSNEESDWNKGLGLVDAHVSKLPEGPNIGFKIVNATTGQKEYYFQNNFGILTESFTTKTEVIETYTIKSTEYLASFSTGQIHAFQYHPELSGEDGVSILKTYLEMYSQ